MWQIAKFRWCSKRNVGGVAKVAIYQENACGTYFSNAEEVATFLTEKFENKDFPEYAISEIKSDELEPTRTSFAQLKFKRVDGLSSFHVIIFTPGHKTFIAANEYCICEKCQYDL